MRVFGILATMALLSSGLASGCESQDSFVAAPKRCLDYSSGEVSGGSLPLPDGDGDTYESTLYFDGFAEGERLEDIAQLEELCVTMEHSYLRDLQIEIVCPSGNVGELVSYLGRDHPQNITLGSPIEDDDYASAPDPGEGAEYCWRPDSANPDMVSFAVEAQLNELPADDYSAVGGFEELEGCALNGRWLLRIQDLWPRDNGFIFGWTISFDRDLVSLECSP